MADDLNMSKEKSNSLEYYNIFDLDKISGKNVDSCCIIGVGNITVICGIINKIRATVDQVVVVDEDNVNIMLKNMNIKNIQLDFVDINEIDKNGNLPKEFDNMEYDLVIGNPPYMRDLHLKILDKVYSHVKEGGEIVWLAPVTRLVDIRNIYDEKTIKKFNEYNYIFKDIQKLNVISRKQMEEIFNVAPPNTIGCIKIKKDKNVKNIEAEKFIGLSDKLNNKIKNIINILMDNKFQKNSKNDKNYKFQLNIPFWAGHKELHDFFTLTSENYNVAIKYESNSLEKFKGKDRYLLENEMYFPTEKDRYNFWKFWLSNFGRFLISLYKVNIKLALYYKYIPYLWWENEEEAKKFFNITDEEIAEIAKVTMTNCN